MKYFTPRARTQALSFLRPRRLALACAGLCVFTAQAQVNMADSALLAQNLRAPALSETVVTATRTVQPLSDLVADVSIVDRDSIERSGATGLGDLLARLPGVEMSRNGGPGTTTSLFLRGAESRFTAVYIDGVRMDSQSTGGAAWESIPLGLIDRIEVLRGPAGAVYGSDALGGVIQIFTKRGEKGFAPFVSVGVGNRGTTKLEAGVSGASGTVDYALGLLRDESDGFNARPIAGQNPDKDGYRNTAGNARVGVQLNSVHRLEGTLMVGDTNSGYDSGLGKDDRNLHTMHALGLHWQAQWSSAYKTKFSVTDSRDEYETKPSVYLSDTRLRGYLSRTNGAKVRTWSQPRWSAAKTTWRTTPSTATARKTVWRWAMATTPVGTRCRSMCATTKTASLVARAPAAWPMATPSRPSGAPRHRWARPSVRPRCTSVSASTACLH